MTQTNDAGDEIVPISVDFIHLDDSLEVELEAAFPEADIARTNAFSGQALLSLLVDTSAATIKPLAELFLRWKNRGQKVTIKIGDIEASIGGFNANDTAQMMAEVRKVIKEARR